MNSEKDNRQYDRDQKQNSQQSSNDNHHDTKSNDQNQNDDNQDLEQASKDLERRWQDIEKHYRRRYPNITDEDVNFRTGEFDNMTDRIAKRTNRNRKDVNDEIRNWNS